MNSAGGRVRFGPATMWTRHAARLISLLERHGGHRAEMLRRAGLSGGQLDDLDGRVPLVAIYEAFEQAMETSRDPLLGVRVASSVTASDLDAQAFLMLTSPTMGEAIERLDRFGDAFLSGERSHWFVASDGVHHEFVPYGPDRPAHHQIAELVLYEDARNIRRLFGADVAPREIRLRHRQAGGIDYTDVFGCPVRFGQDCYEALFPAALVDVPIPSASPALAPLVDRYLEGMLSTMPAEGALSARVVDVIGTCLESGVPTLAELAARFEMSPRSFQRALRSEGTSLRALANLVRRAKGTTLIAAGRPVTEVAHLLGYADQAAFDRAFRRWTGTTPTAYRTG